MSILSSNRTLALLDGENWIASRHSQDASRKAAIGPRTQCQFLGLYNELAAVHSRFQGMTAIAPKAVVRSPLYKN